MQCHIRMYLVSVPFPGRGSLEPRGSSVSFLIHKGPLSTLPEFMLMWRLRLGPG